MASDNQELPFAMKKAIKDTEAKRDAALKKISAASGIEWTFDCDWAALNSSPSATQPGRNHGWLASAVVEYLNTLAKCFEDKKNSDPMVKEEVVRKCTNKRVYLKVVDGTGHQPKIAFEDGSVVVLIDPKHVWSNVNDMLAIKFENLL